MVHDFISLVELQAQLLRLDMRESLRRMVIPCVLLFAAVLTGAGCFPVALVAMAILLTNSVGLTPALSFFIAFVIGLTVSGSLVLAGWIYFRKGIHVFERSRAEWVRTVQWIKQVLKRSTSAETRPIGVRRPQEH